MAAKSIAQCYKSRSFCFISVVGKEAERNIEKRVCEYVCVYVCVQ